MNIKFADKNLPALTLQILIGAIGYNVMMCRRFCDMARSNRGNPMVHAAQLRVAKQHALDIKNLRLGRTLTRI